MHTLSFLKNRLIRLYFFVLSSNYYLPYKYIVVKAFTSGRQKILYLLRFLFPLNHILARLVLAFASSLHIFTSLVRGSTFFVPARFWLLILHHFMFFYEALLTIRLIAEWYPSVNLHQGGIIEQIIFNLSEPYFKAFEEILPKGLSALFSFYLIEHISSIIEIFYRTLVLYGGGCKKKSWIENVDLIVMAISGENLITV
uniref:Uncharacterized protein n=2 Tax=Vischeria TaxID=44431 RepID=A0A5P8T0M0_9STRA|nr:hypothetical protein NUH79_pgp035 [Vischeria punctata]AOW70921.1 hypothetical protein [Vischeria sp. CAUP Q 202]QFR99739.1 hypothetical protein [Vischeria stellata]UTV00928.1 hypothetical protein [Vischeria punctata]